MHRRARAARLRCRQAGAGAQARGARGRGRALADGRRSPGLGPEPAPAKAGDRDTLPALDEGKAAWPSLREAVYDSAFTADRCREWSNLHGMRHRIAARDPAAKGFASFPGGGWLSAVSVGSRIGAASFATALDALMLPPAASPSSPFSPASRPSSIRCQSATRQRDVTQTGS